MGWGFGKKYCMARGKGVEGAPACTSNAEVATQSHSYRKEEASSCFPGHHFLLPLEQHRGGRSCCQLQPPPSQLALFHERLISVTPKSAYCTWVLVFAQICGALTSFTGHSLLEPLRPKENVFVELMELMRESPSRGGPRAANFVVGGLHLVVVDLWCTRSSTSSRGFHTLAGPCCGSANLPFIGLVHCQNGRCKHALPPRKRALAGRRFAKRSAKVQGGARGRSETRRCMDE